MKNSSRTRQTFGLIGWLAVAFAAASAGAVASVHAADFWVTFASALAFKTWQLNPQLLASH